METFDGYKIRRLRKENGLTIQEIAKLVDLSPSAIGMYERGVRKPDLSLALKLSKLFKKNVTYFYTSEGDDVNYLGLDREIADLAKDLDLDTISKRDKVAKEVLQRANGYCELCNQFAPFIGYDGEPYLELHKIEKQFNSMDISRDTFVALCPNCNKKLKVLRLKGDIIYLVNKVKSSGGHL